MDTQRACVALLASFVLILAACPADPPAPRLTAVDDEAVIHEDGEVVIAVLANDLDEAGDPLAVIEVEAPRNGTATERAGAVVYRPNRDWHGEDAFGYTVRSLSGAEAQAQVTVTVNPVNDPPVARHDVTGLLEDGTARIAVLENDTDPEGDPLAIHAHGQGLGGRVHQDGDDLVYVADADFHGADAFTYQVTDGNGGVALATVSVTVDAVNDAPLANPDAVALVEDQSVLVDVLGNDTDPDGDAITLVAFEQGAHGVVTEEAGGLRYVPGADFHGTDTFTYEIADPGDARATGRVNVAVGPVNDAPVAQDDEAEVDEDGTTLVHVLANDTDVDGDTLTVVSFEQGANGAVTLEGGRLRYTAAGEFAGADAFGYTIEDGAGGSASALVRVTVNAVNDAPVANDDVAAVDEDGSVLVDVLANDTDVDGDTLTVASFEQGASGAVTAEAGGLRYTPAADWAGVDAFGYEVSDGNGATATAQVVITVRAMNDDLTAVDDAASVDEDGAVLVEVLDNDLDLDGTGILLSTFTQGAHGAVTRVGDALRYAPSLDFHGADAFTYEITDSVGQLASATVNVTVLPVNDAPVAQDDAAELDEGGSSLVAVLVNDGDVDGDALAISGFTQGSSGVVTQEGDALRYVPDAWFNGADAFTYDVADGHGGSDTATVTVTVNAVNDAPTANDDAATVDEDGTTLVDVLVNDTDVDGDTLAITSFTQGAHGAVGQEGDSLRYTPSADFHGADAFDYEVSDYNGGVATATVVVTVSPVNDVPVAGNDAVAVDEDGTILVNVLVNDTDLDGDTLMITGFTQGTRGTVSQEGDSLRYTPNANFNGSDSFMYEISDQMGGIASATVDVTIAPVNDLPVALDDAVIVNQDGTVLVDVLVNDTDVDGDTLMISGFTQGYRGTVTQEGDSLRYTPYAGFTGSDAFMYEISDQMGGITTATVTVDVHGP